MADTRGLPPGASFVTNKMSNGRRAPASYAVMLDGRPMGDVDGLYARSEWMATDPAGREQRGFRTRLEAALSLL